MGIAWDGVGMGWGGLQRPGGGGRFGFVRNFAGCCSQQGGAVHPAGGGDGCRVRGRGVHRLGSVLTSGLSSPKGIAWAAATAMANTVEKKRRFIIAWD